MPENKHAPESFRVEHARERGFDPDRLRRITQSAQSDIHLKRSDGYAVQITRAGEVVFNTLLGYKDRQAGTALTEDCLFSTMSSGKQFVNALVLSYIERGMLRLHTPVADVLPAFGCRGKDRVTLEQLLTHTSGILPGFPMLPPDVLSNQTLVANFVSESALVGASGKQVNYSFMAAHAIMSAMLLAVDGRGRSLGKFLDDELFSPLGMSDTSLGSRPDRLDREVPIKSNFFGPGMTDEAGVAGIAALMGIPGCEIAAGGYRSTLHDFGRFALMLRNGGELDGFRLLSPAMIRLAARNHTGNFPNDAYGYTISHRRWSEMPANLGLGFYVRGEGTIAGPFGMLNSPGAFGGIGAGTTMFWVDPEFDVTVAMLTTGLMDESDHLERCGRISDLVLSAIIK